MASNVWRPVSTGDAVNDRNLSIMMDMINALTRKLTDLTSSKTPAVTLSQVQNLVNPANLVKEFEAGGKAPLNLTGLQGVAGTPQIAGIPILASVPLPNDPLFIKTAAVVVGGVLYVNDNGVFVGNTVGITSITISGGSTGLTGGSLTTPGGTITLAGTLNVANGGTGATTATNARTNLSAAKSGANSDITSLVSGILIGTSKVSTGAGSPNGSVTGSPGDLYLNSSGGASTTLWVKESGVATNSGWIGK